MTDTSADSRRIRRITLAMLLLVYILNFIDRQIVGILQEPIKAEFGLDDWQLGLMTGVAFALFYTTLGLPIARLADRGVKRTTIITCSLAVWSVMTACCGLAQSYAQLLLARVGVGIGEAGCSPSSMSLIADHYGPERRGRAMGIFGLGIPIGSMLGVGLGGWLADAFGWRTAVMVVGLPGLALALVFRAIVPEPRRGVVDGAGAGRLPTATFGEVFRVMVRKRSFLHLLAAGSLGSFCSAGLFIWFPAFFARTHGMSLVEVGLWWGAAVGVAGVTGTFGGGWLSDRFGGRNARIVLLIPTAAFVIALPFYFAAVTASSGMAALAFLFVPTVMSSLWIAPNMALGQSLAPIHMRVTVAASALLVNNLLGVGLGPLIVGAISDHFTRITGDAGEGLRTAMMVVGVAYGWTALHFWLASRSVVADVTNSELLSRNAVGNSPLPAM